ncbi:MAG TPA: SDR family NAD(P)-dependent oxidoreductase [Candidatus Dormibacteraeota bacterium]|nr:SDR family NAD(P)-dependent oxidoreductase [Candidatus Dormibacteraeota bacterium]
MRNGLGSPQSVAIFGAGSDIAMATARALVDARARRLVLAGRRPEELAAAAEELRARGAERVECLRFDAEDGASHPAVVDAAVEALGEIDLALLAFGVLGDQRRAPEDAELAGRILRTNLLGAVSLTIPLVGRMREQGHGTVVALSSVAAERPRRANYVYGASKAGMDAYFQGLADSLAGSGVEVMVVRPGFVHTKMTAGMPAAPLSTTAEAVAAEVVRGLGARAGTVWAPARLRWVMAVLRHLPRPLWRRMPG